MHFPPFIQSTTSLDVTHYFLGLSSLVLQEVEQLPEEEDLFAEKRRKEEEKFVYMTNQVYKSQCQLIASLG